MCGINGILLFNDAAAYPDAHYHDVIGRMNKATAHRGPDGDGIFVRHPVCLGHRRLSIIDLSVNGAQPMFNATGSAVIVFNGEIYNYLELAEELRQKGHTFKSRTDTEVILHCYEEYGPDCVTKFNGMWAFAIYDFDKRLLFASRDRFGVKPFFYHVDEESLVFSSEVKGILQYKRITEANLGKLYDYLAYGYRNNNGDSFFKGIHELKAGHNLTVAQGAVQCRRYWRIPEAPENGGPVTSYEALKDQLVQLLTDSVKLRFRSDVPVGITLSGGLDSSALTSIVDDLIERHALLYKQVAAYSAWFPGFALDESRLVQEFVETCKHIKLEQRFPSSVGLLGSLDKLVYGMGEPIFSTTVFAHHELMKSIKEAGVKVVINGQGSDEAFGGYGRYIVGHRLIEILLTDPACLLGQLRAISRQMKFSYAHILAQVVKAVLSRRAASYLRAKYQEQIIGCLQRDFVRRHYQYLENDDQRALSSDKVNGYLRANMQDYSFAQILHYEDHSAMQQSIEIRSPFLDYRIVEFAFSLPTKYKFDMGSTKKIIRDSFRGRLPSSIVDGHEKVGFVTPFASWLQDRDFNAYVMDTIQSSSFRSKAIWNAEAIAARFRSPETNPNFPYWRILNTELWSRQYQIGNLG